MINKYLCVENSHIFVGTVIQCLFSVERKPFVVLLMLINSEWRETAVRLP